MHICSQACLEQEARVAELRSLAARVAAETGSRALQADADALARRLQLVSGAVQALADLGEARQLARAKAQHAKEMFCDMRQVHISSLQIARYLIVTGQL